MDAISFVLGERTRHLRVTKLSVRHFKINYLFRILFMDLLLENPFQRPLPLQLFIKCQTGLNDALVATSAVIHLNIALTEQ